MFTVFAVSGLSGTGLLAYEYYKAFEERRQRDMAELQQQQQQEEAERGAQEETQRLEADIARLTRQVRGAIANKNWGLAQSYLDLAQSYLDQAAAMNPDHPSIAAVRSELLAAQRPATKLKTRTDNKINLQLNWIEGDCFDMGSPLTERDRSGDEPSHRACTKGFWIGQTEITNSQYRLFKPSHDSGSFQGRPLSRDTQPAVNLSWDDAKAFTEWLSWESGTGKRFRLPTETEWEYAARAGTTTRYYWGNDIDPRYANFSELRQLFRPQ